MLEALPCAVVAPVSRARHAPTVRRVGHSSPLLDSVVPFLTLFLLAIGVSADAFAVALGRGLSLRSGVVRNGLILALAFGVAQAVMPLLGWLLGTAFAEVIAPFDHWIAFALLFLVGAKMLWEALTPDGDDAPDSEDRSTVREILVLALATSIDALVVGVSLTFWDVSIWVAIAVIGLVTVVFSLAAVLLGHRIGTRFRRPAEIVGGIVLIGIGVSILVKHLTA